MAMPSVKPSPLADLPTLPPERCRKSDRNPKQVQLDRRSRCRAGITCQTLVPRHPVVCSLLPGEWSAGLRGEERSDLLGGDRYRLGAKPMHPVASALASAPVPPHDGIASRRKHRGHLWRRWRPEKRPQNGTHPTRFLGFGSIPQTLLAQQAGTAMTDPSGIHDTHAAAAFRPSFLCIERLPCRAAQRPIRLWEKGFSGKTSHLCGSCPQRWPIGNVRRLVGHR